MNNNKNIDLEDLMKNYGALIAFWWYLFVRKQSIDIDDEDSQW